MFQQAVDHCLDGHAFGLGAVAEQDAVAERGVGERADVLGRDVDPAREQRPGLRPQHQELPGAQAGAPAHPVVDEVGRLGPGPAGRGQPHGVADHVLGDRHLADDLVERAARPRR